jgi:mRNA-degrading endonuclease YafQ of YafQ-DinJ toxin-antitoxin module
MRVHYKGAFLRSLKRLSSGDRARTEEVVHKTLQLFGTVSLPHGLGLKKLFGRKGFGAVFEARATLWLRVLFAVQEDLVSFLMIGTHDEVRRFIRSFR